MHHQPHHQLVLSIFCLSTVEKGEQTIFSHRYPVRPSNLSVSGAHIGV